VTNFFSKPIANVNRRFFKKKLDTLLDAQHRPYIVEIEKGQDPFEDKYGRVTFFFCQLANTKVPIFQPGTVMFESAVVSTSTLTVHAKGSQQNGPILGNGCALFLAKFMACLIRLYDEKCSGK